MPLSFRLNAVNAAISPAQRRYAATPAGQRRQRRIFGVQDR